jgi:hypothetical protein
VAFGDFSNDRKQLSFPNLDSLPIATPISFTLRIVTTTKPLKISEVIAQLAKGKAVFPAPPSDPSSINISLDKEIWLKARIARAGRRVDGVNIVPRDCHFIASEPDWINVSELEDGEQIGQYRRVIMLEFIASFGAHPSINTETIKCQVRALCTFLHLVLIRNSMYFAYMFHSLALGMTSSTT